MQLLDMPVPDTDRVLERGGVGIRFRVFDAAGAGAESDAVLLLAPWAIVPSDIWAPQVKALSASYRVVVIDGRGSGGSGRPRTADAYRSEEYTADAIAVLDSLGIERAHLVGLSFGGHVAALIAAEHPERTLSATLIAPSAPFGPANPHMTPENFLRPRSGEQGWALFNRAAFLEDYEAFARFFMSEAIHEPNCEALVAQGVRFAQQTDGATLALTIMARANSARTEGQALYQRIRCPAQVIHGGADRIVPVEKGRLVAETLGACFHMLEDAGHVPTQTRASTVNGMLLGFLHEMRMPARRGHAAARTSHIQTNQGA